MRETINTKLRECRKSLRLTQEEAAKLLGITRRTYIKYEQGELSENSMKCQFVIETLRKSSLIDEEHGVLTLDFIKSQCTELFRKYSIDFCYLFGSYAKGTAKGKSDVDLLISMPVDGGEYYEILELLRETLHKKIDLIHDTQLNNNIKLTKEIFKYGIKIYG